MTASQGASPPLSSHSPIAPFVGRPLQLSLFRVSLELQRMFYSGTLLFAPPTSVSYSLTSAGHDTAALGIAQPANRRASLTRSSHLPPSVPSGPKRHHDLLAPLAFVSSQPSSHTVTAATGRYFTPHVPDPTSIVPRAFINLLRLASVTASPSHHRASITHSTSSAPLLEDHTSSRPPLSSSSLQSPHLRALSLIQSAVYDKSMKMQLPAKVWLFAGRPQTIHFQNLTLQRQNVDLYLSKPFAFTSAGPNTPSTSQTLIRAERSAVGPGGASSIHVMLNTVSVIEQARAWTGQGNTSFNMGNSASSPASSSSSSTASQSSSNGSPDSSLMTSASDPSSFSQLLLMTKQDTLEDRQATASRVHKGFFAVWDDANSLAVTELCAVEGELVR